MSSPSPDPQKSADLAYTSGESTDHSSVIAHSCTCCESTKAALDVPKTETAHTHHGHHNHINLTHVPPPSATNHVHPQVHVHVHASQKTTPTCTCHLQESVDVGGGVDHLQHLHHEAVQGRKLDADDRIEVSPLPPALPPRPPPRPRYDGGTRCRIRESSPGGSRIRKYVFWCCACGGLATVLGALFLAVYFLLRSYTSTLGYFETIPTFVPATMLILTGLCVMSLARRKNRYSYLLKVCGLCCLVCALTCVLVTITTTVIHMNRLQTLRECVYTQKTRTCTCYSVLLEAHAQTDEGMRFVFDSTPDCEVIHGALYTCLRAMFGLSVSGILVCIFSCMLVYQLLSHERKKMYWEQLELRCRSFYQQHGGPSGSAPSSIRGPPLPPATYCSCCEECRYPSITAPPQVYPWDAHPTERFWTPGRVGNFYSPNPGEDLQPPEGRERIISGWNWRRLPWTRTANQNSIPDNQRDNSLTYQGIASSADSQYGFSNRSAVEPNVPVVPSSNGGSYSVLDGRPPVGGVYVWGPPPPYSNPNSPARRPLHSPPARYHHVHHHVHPHDTHCQLNDVQDFRRHRKDNYENAVEADAQVENSDTSSSCADRVSHTLPARKTKKRVEVSSVKAPVAACRTNVKNVFDGEDKLEEEHKYHEPDLKQPDEQCRFLPRLQGVENAAFQKQESGVGQKAEATESEVYFADVSSCCNISVRNDGQDSSLYDEAQDPRLLSLHKQDCAEKEQVPKVAEDEDYLAHKLGNRQMSTRSRLPFPLPEDEPLPGIPKDISQASLCSSSAQTPMTESTDDCTTPGCYPDSRGFSNEFLAPDAQYEVIRDSYEPSNLTSTISNLNSYAQTYMPPQFAKSTPPKTLNLNQATPRRNITALIHNLGANPGGLLYSEANNSGAEEEEEEEETQGQGSHSDATIDSGWQSGSEKVGEKLELNKPVNV